MTAPTSREAPNPSHVMLELRHAFDDENVVVKNLMLRKAHDCIERLLSSAQTPARPTDAELLGVLNAARVALKSRDQSSFDMRVLGGLKAAIAMLETVSPDSSTDRGGK